MSWSKELATLLPNTAFSGNSVVLGDRARGDGFYGRSDGLHTVAWNTVGFVGTIKIQGSLAIDPTEEDWFDIEFGGIDEYTLDTTGKLSKNNITEISYSQPTTDAKVFNFTGNYVWIRAKIENFGAGSVTAIQYNH